LKAVWWPLLFVLSPLLSSPAQAGQPTLLGVFSPPACKPEAPPQLKPLFVSIAGRWTTLDSATTGRLISSRIDWMVAWKGASIGRLQTVAPGTLFNDEWAFRRDFWLSTSSPPPRLPDDKNGRFGGWCPSSGRVPLAVVHQGSSADPEQWRPFVPTKARTLARHPAFLQHADQAWLCPPGKAPETLSARPEDLAALDAYRDRNNRQVIQMALKPEDLACDGPDAGWLAHTFFLGENGQAQYLGTGLTWVDAADYDADGHSELLFWHSAYNREGYVLYSPFTGARAEYLWSYH
jgi:hypothetical protein